MPPEAQTRLLRALQSGRIRRVGGREEIAIDVRIIAATNRDLAPMIAAGSFREDLYYRLNVVPIHLPPLRERTGDIEPLARHFLRRAAAEGLPARGAVEGGRRAARGAAVARQRARAAQLRVPRRAAVARGARSTPPTVRQLLAERPAAEAAAARRISPARSPPGSARPSRRHGALYHGALAAFEKPLFEHALRETGGNQLRAAQLLGINRNTLAQAARRPRRSIPNASAAGDSWRRRQKALAMLQQGRCNSATMASTPGPEPAFRNVAPLPALVAARAGRRAPGQPLPLAGDRRRGSAGGDARSAPTSRSPARRIRGELVPSGAGGRDARRHADPGDDAGRAVRAAPGDPPRRRHDARGCTSTWCSSSRWSRRSRRCWWRSSPASCSSRASQFWFSDNSRGILENANELARGYYDENQRDVGDETVAMAGDLRDYPAAGLDHRARTSTTATAYQVVYRELNESAILQQAPDGELRIAGDRRSGAKTARRASASRPTTLDRLRAGEEVVVIASPERIEAVAPIDRDVGHLPLHRARRRVQLRFSQWERAQSVARALRGARPQRARVLQLQFNLALFGVSLALVGLAVWFALRFADRQVKPLAELVTAAREVGAGNYALRVDGPHRARRDRPAQPRLQPHDRADRAADRRADRRQPPARRAPRVHRGGAAVDHRGHRLGRRARARSC